MNPPPLHRDPTAFILRTVDGAARPIPVEKVFGLWMGNVIHLHSADRVRDHYFIWWPEPGAAWEAFKEPILRLIEQGELVMCANTDPPDHPEHHLTEGHAEHKTFSYGTAPMVLRYLATPAGSLAWRAILDERLSRQQEAEAEAARYEEQLRKWIHELLAVRPLTAGQLARKLHARRGDVAQAIAAMAGDGQISYAGRTLWRKARWKASAAT